MTTYERLRREARAAAEARGHRLGRFDDWGANGFGGRKGHAVCTNDLPHNPPGTFPQDTRCLQWVLIETSPAPNSIEISGPAVAVDCRKFPPCHRGAANCGPGRIPANAQHFPGALVCSERCGAILRSPSHAFRTRPDGDQERDTTCIGCGKSITVLRGGYADAWNACGPACYERRDAPIHWYTGLPIAPAPGIGGTV